MPCAEVLEICFVGLALPPSLALHILQSSGCAHPESHDEREADIVEEGTSRKMRVTITLAMQCSMSNRRLEALDLVTGEGHKKHRKRFQMFKLCSCLTGSVLRCNLAE